MKAITLLLIIFVFLSINLTAQSAFREFNTNDSTAHILNVDTTIVVSENKLYFQTSEGMTLFYDFSTADTTRFIRDFDIISNNVWYVIYGRKNWGDSTILYKTVDKGVSWISDTSIFEATTEAYNTGLISEESLYQLQPISEDTLLLFVGYYQSGIFYSVDSGQSWNLWFANTIANYKGIFECGEKYFLWGQEGDGFRGSMFMFDSDLLLSPDTNDVWTHWSGSYVYHPDCYNGTNPDCIFAPNSMSGYDQFLFFQNYINENCADAIVNIPPDPTSTNFKIFPNPTDNGQFTIQGTGDLSATASFKIFKADGQLILTDKIKSSESVSINLSDFSHGRGIYFVKIEYEDSVINNKIVFY